MTLLARFGTPPAGVAVEAFIVANLGFLGVDIALAHAANEFARAEEWIPLGYSAVATLLLLPGLLSPRLRARMRGVAIAVAIGAVVVGVAGMVLHLESAFFATQTLRDLVYTAPFVAPLAYVGVGLLLLLNRMETWGSVAWRRWVVFLAFGGFVGNLALALLDHAQNGFFEVEEWASVVVAAFGTSFLFLVVLRPDDAPLVRACRWVLAASALTGLLGFALHLLANLEPTDASFEQRMLHGAPVFAPLLLVDLALLAALGLSGPSPSQNAA